ncbi:MAG TPA: 23S rRNA (pseudouridine(1915)-N(3))-methyltransferase RlmH [Paracoccaceae bacterium]|nr:23S rRNA (pseudouridine(1915)-N(3))-methyltransferase RlmH [Paracoccaceae bacterium]
MKLTIAAVGRLKAGPERALLDDWLSRAGATGRPLGLGPVEMAEVDERKFGDRDAQSRRLLEAVPAGAMAVALDERGKTMTSPGFARLIGRERDGGCARMVFLIGGADGLTEDARRAAAHRLSFGPMVWPHMLARLMLAEQIYRATTILAGLPYHRE